MVYSIRWFYQIYMFWLFIKVFCKLYIMFHPTYSLYISYRLLIHTLYWCFLVHTILAFIKFTKCAWKYLALWEPKRDLCDIQDLQSVYGYPHLFTLHKWLLGERTWNKLWVVRRCRHQCPTLNKLSFCINRVPIH